MADRAFERYKETLRRGHVAALRGALDEAVEAYREAATIAPDRAIPLTSLGAVLRRLDRVDDALAAYVRALGRSPSDVVALAGRAESLVTLERWSAAAEGYIALAEVHLAEGRRADAETAARRALELVDHVAPRGSMGRLVGRLRGAEAVPGPAALAARARALVAESTDDQVDVVVGRRGAVGGSVPGSPADVKAGAVDAPAQAPEGGEPGAPPAMRERTGPIALIRAAERHMDASDGAAALEAYLAAAAELGEDRWRLALDACAQALAIAPTDRRLHLDMAELYLAAGWTSLAADKLRLLARLASLDEDRETADRVCAIARARLADDPELAALCP